MTIRTILVDDEPLAIQGLELRLQAHEDVEIIAKCQNGREAISAIKTHKPDLAFLDPGGMWGAERVDALHRPEVLAGFAGAAGLAALLTVAGLFVRDANEYRQSQRQITASRLQAFTALLWLTALCAFAVFATLAAEPGRLQRHWPDPWLVGASSAALGAGLLTLAQLTQLPGAWRSDRRVHGWTAGRKLRHTLTVLVFGAFAFVLLGWGALEPWSS